MVHAIAHRGPDGNGLLIQKHAALGHARLAIIDIEGGNQPMSSPDGEVSIVFNGEIYNFNELRRQLLACGCTFRTASDTEVILQIYLREGSQGFSRLRGMYAFAIWDGRYDTGLLVRDPIGIKPLFIQENSQRELAFASEAKAILARDCLPGTLDEAALHLLFNFRYLPGNRSLFRGIRQLLPGHVLEWRPDGKIKEYAFPQPASALQADANILELLEESVASHFTSDVEVGAYLSGGIDSAVIVALGKRLGHSNLRTFTLKVGDDPNEAANAAETAQLLGVVNFQESCQSDLRETLPRLIWHLEIPKVNALQVSELARYTTRHVKVALSGLGGDELFLGYNAHRIMHLADLARQSIPNILSQLAASSAIRVTHMLPGPEWSEPVRMSLMLKALGNWPRVYGLLRNVWDCPEMRKQIYGPRLLDANLPDAFTVLESAWPDGHDPVAGMAKYEWREKMVNDLLWQEDRCSMAEGLEVRVPFLDTHLAATPHSLDRQILMPKGKLKGYLRKTLEEVLPVEILNRRKSGFQVNAPHFFHKNLSSLADELLSPERIQYHGLFNPKFIKQIRKYNPRQGLRWHYFILYLMLNTHLWIELFEQQTRLTARKISNA